MNCKLYPKFGVALCTVLFALFVNVGSITGAVQYEVTSSIDQISQITEQGVNPKNEKPKINNVQEGRSDNESGPLKAADVFRPDYTEDGQFNLPQGVAAMSASTATEVTEALGHTGISRFSINDSGVPAFCVNSNKYSPDVDDEYNTVAGSSINFRNNNLTNAQIQDKVQRTMNLMNHPDYAPSVLPSYIGDNFYRAISRVVWKWTDNYNVNDEYSWVANDGNTYMESDIVAWVNNEELLPADVLWLDPVDPDFQPEVLLDRPDICDALVSDNIDTDLDGVTDACDLDDDNDGIIDTDESNCAYVPLDFDGITNSNKSLSDVALSDGVTFDITYNTSSSSTLTDRPTGYSDGSILMGIATGDAEHMEYTIVFSSPVIIKLNQADLNGWFNYDERWTVTSIGAPLKADAPVISHSGIGDLLDLDGDGNDNTGPELRDIRGDNTNVLSFVPNTDSHVPPASSEWSVTSDGYVTAISFSFEESEYSTKSPGTAEYSVIAIGVSCVEEDTDGDGIANHLDTDSDNDGCPDAIEGGGSITFDDITGGRIGGGVDPDSGVPTAVGTSQTIGTSQDDSLQSDECDPCNSSSTLFSDNDGDNVGDVCDLDDDNDGILDADECVGALAFGEDFGTGTTITATPYTNYTFDFRDGEGNLTDGGYIIADNPQDGQSIFWVSSDDHTTGDTDGKMLLVNASYTPGEFYRRDGITVTANTEYKFEAFFMSVVGFGVCNPEVPAKVLFIIEDSGGMEIARFNSDNFYSTSSPEWKRAYRVFNSGNSTSINLVLVNDAPGGCGNDIAIDDITLREFECDTDGDGIANHLDNDSDNDGCPDAIEGAGSFSLLDLDNDDMLDGGFNEDGVSTLVGSPQGTTDAVTDSTDASACIEPPVATDNEDLGNTVGTDVTQQIITEDDGDGVDSDPDGTINESTVSFVPAMGSTGTDTDNDGDIDEVVVPGEGVWTVDEMGNVTFSPEANYTDDPTPINYTIDDNDGNTSNEATITVDYHQTGSIGDTVFEDEDNNGVFDAGEGLEGVTVTLTGTDVDGNSVNLTDVTDSNGYYSFDELIEGTYTVTVVDNSLPNSLKGDNTIDPDDTDDGSTVISLGEGEDVDNADFGYYSPLGILGNKVFEDLNGNGSFNSGEGIQGVTVTLSGTDVDGNPVNRTTTTNNNGNYKFNNLEEGDYTITVDESDLPASLQGNITVDPDGGSDSESYYELGEGETNNAQDFGYVAPLGSIGDTVFEDVDNSGTPDSGEGLEGVTVTLTGTDVDGNSVNLTAVTDADGEYTFKDLVEGTYTVTVDESTLPVSLQGDNTVDPDATDDGSTVISLGEGENVDDADFGYHSPLGSIGDTVFEDVDNNGAPDSGEGLEGVTVILTGADVDGVLVNLTAVTDADGEYTFEDLVEGTYTVTVSNNTLPSSLQGDNTVDPDNMDDGSTVISLGDGDDVDTADFGYYSPLGSIGDTVFEDVDNSGTPDSGEGLEGVTVTLTGTDVDGNSVNLTAVTDADGEYTFEELVEGTYTVTVDESTLPVSLQGDNTVDPDATDDGSTVISLGEGDNVDTADFGYYSPLGSIGDLIWEDLDGNGVYDVGETLLENVTITLTGTDVDGIAVNVTARSDEEGEYLFENLEQGTYTVTVDESTLPAALQGGNTVDPNGGNDSESIVNLGEGAEELDEDFGYRTLGALSGYVREDIDQDGEGELPISGVTITLYDDMDNVKATTTTNGQGFYEFLNLEPGVYRVSETDPSSGANYGWTSVSDIDGGDPNDIGTVSVVYGFATQDNDFVDERMARVHGHVYFDKNNDGMQSTNPADGEVNLGGVRVLIADRDGVETTVYTNAQGDWSIVTYPGQYTATVNEDDIALALGSEDFVQSEGTNNSSHTAVLDANTFAENDGYSLQVSVMGHVYFDTNDDGMQDLDGEDNILGTEDDEPNLPGITVDLTRNGTPIGSITTDENGDWEATVTPGDVIATIDTSDPDFPKGAEQTEGTNPNMVSVTQSGTFHGNDGFSRCLDIDAYVFLEGSLVKLDGSGYATDVMRTSLNDFGLLPGQGQVNSIIGYHYTSGGQPYCDEPWNYCGSEGEDNDVGDGNVGDAGYASTVTDWVLVYLRSEVDGADLCKSAALLHSDGRIELQEDFECCSIFGNNYYVVIEHRHHLVVMSNTNVSVDNNGKIVVDFRNTQSLESGSGVGQRVIGTNGGQTVYAMHSGNGEQSGSTTADTDINSNDKSYWSQENNKLSEYNNADYNMNGDVNRNDESIWKGNNGNFSSIPLD